MSCALEQLRYMHSVQLYSSTSLLSSYVITMMKNCVDLLDPVNQCEILMYNADCHFENREFSKAEVTYRKAMTAFKAITKNKGKMHLANLDLSDVHIKYKIYQCCSEMKNDDGALNALESIPRKQRTVKISLVLAKLYQKREMDRPAITCYKDVLKHCPLALDCFVELLKLGEQPDDLLGMIPSNCNLEWLPTFFKAHACILSKDYPKRVLTFTALNQQAGLSGNPDLLCDLAESCYRSADISTAMQHFNTLHLQDPHWLKGMDLYAYLLSEDGHPAELEKLATHLFSISEVHAEPWTAMGYHAKCNGDYTKAVYLAAKAVELDSFNNQALLLKGASLRMLGEAKVAVSHFKHALKLAPNRLEPYREIMNCYIQENRKNEAVAVAKNAVRILGSYPDSLALYASALMSDPGSYDKVIKITEQALALDPNHKAAIEIRCNITQRQQNYDETIRFLLRAIQQHGCSNLHTMLADCYIHVSKYSDAVDHYNIALSLNPNCTEAKEGLEKIHGIEYGLSHGSEHEDSHEQFINEDDDVDGDDNLHVATTIDWPHETPWF